MFKSQIFPRVRCLKIIAKSKCVSRFSKQLGETAMCPKLWSKRIASERCAHSHEWKMLHSYASAQLSCFLQKIPSTNDRMTSWTRMMIVLSMMREASKHFHRRLLLFHLSLYSRGLQTSFTWVWGLNSFGASLLNCGTFLSKYLQKCFL